MIPTGWISMRAACWGTPPGLSAISRQPVSPPRPTPGSLPCTRSTYAGQATAVPEHNVTGPGHYGRYGSGHPRHRLVNQSQQNKNYRAVCARRVTGPPPKPHLSCDEYPFQSTREGGTTLSKKNWGWAWVPASEQNAQGGYIIGFYNANRVLNGDAFWVEV